MTIVQVYDRVDQDMRGTFRVYHPNPNKRLDWDWPDAVEEARKADLDNWGLDDVIAMMEKRGWIMDATEIEELVF